MQIHDHNLAHVPPYFVMQYFANGDLTTIASALQADGNFQEQVFMAMADCISELHSKSLQHRDIKPQNFLRDNDSLVLSDLGLSKEVKGVDVALAAELVIFGGVMSTGLDRIILVAGDGDYKEAVRFVRRKVGKDVQIVSWRRALSNELIKLANRPTIFLDDHWMALCEVREKPPLDEIPATDEEESSEDIEE